jgi:hypothetical protein
MQYKMLGEMGLFPIEERSGFREAVFRHLPHVGCTPSPKEGCLISLSAVGRISLYNIEDYGLPCPNSGITHLERSVLAATRHFRPFEHVSIYELVSRDRL